MSRTRTPDVAIDRRDWLGLAAGVAALTCSGVGAIFVGVVGLASLVGRNWRVALFHTVPLGLMYGSWSLAFGSAQGTESGRVSPRVLDFTWQGMRRTFEALGQSQLLGIALATMMLGGLTVALRGMRDPAERRRLAAPIALLLGSLAFLFATGTQRVDQFGAGYAGSSRYLHIIAAMILPALACAAHALSRRSSLAAGAVLVVLVAGIPGNVLMLAHAHDDQKWLHTTLQQIALTVPQLELAQQVPPDTRIEPWLAPRLNIGFLVDEYAAGHLPHVETGRRIRTTARLYVALAQRPDVFAQQRTCEPVRGDTITLERGETMVVDEDTQFRMQLVGDEGQLSLPKRIHTSVGHTFVALAGPLDLELEAPDGPESRSVRHCGRPGAELPDQGAA